MNHKCMHDNNGTIDSLQFSHGLINANNEAIGLHMDILIEGATPITVFGLNET